MLRAIGLSFLCLGFVVFTACRREMSSALHIDAETSAANESPIAPVDEAPLIIEEYFEAPVEDLAEELVVTTELLENAVQPSTSSANDLETTSGTQLEFQPLGDTTMPNNDLLAAVSSHYGSAFEGRGSAMRDDRIARAADDPTIGPPMPSPDALSMMIEARGGASVEFKSRRNEAASAERNAVAAKLDQQRVVQLEAFPKPARPAAPAEGAPHGERFARIAENSFQWVKDQPLSTFSIDVDTASYSKARQFLLDYRRLPPPDAVRIEELINYFPYDYNEPMDAHPFAADMEVAQCPWQPEHRLARIAIKGKEMKRDGRPASNLVFLVDVSGSMNRPNRLPLVVRGLQMLTRELGKNDRVAIVVYAGAAGLVLPSTTGDQHAVIEKALAALQAGGSTAGGAGLQLAYKIASDNFIHAGVNRVILCTDGDFNVGVSDTGGIIGLATDQAKKNVFLSVLGFGFDNLNDQMLEQVANKANGIYAFIDTENEARKVLVEQMSGTLVTIAKDVKIQIKFNPAKVQGYRLIGYENRILAAQDFNDDKKDAGEIGAGHTVTALYEIVPVGAKTVFRKRSVDDLKYQRERQLIDDAATTELLTLKLRYKTPEAEVSTLLSEPVDDSTQAFGKVSGDFKFAAAVASFGMLLRDSEHAGDATLDTVLEIAADGAKVDKWGYRKEFLEIVQRAKELKK